MHESRISEPAIDESDGVDGEEVYNPENGEVLVEEEETPEPEVVDEVPGDSPIAESNSKIEEVPKKSYAFIVSSYHIERCFLLFYL